MPMYDKSNVQRSSQEQVPVSPSNGNPGTIYNTPPPVPQFSYGYSQDSYAGGVGYGGQNAYLGRYTPLLLDNNGQWIDNRGPYAYNTPNNYGSFVPQFGPPPAPPQHQVESASSQIQQAIAEHSAGAPGWGLAEVTPPPMPIYSKPLRTDTKYPVQVQTVPDTSIPTTTDAAVLPNSAAARFAAWKARRLARLQGANGQGGGGPGDHFSATGTATQLGAGGSFRGASSNTPLRRAFESTTKI